MTRDTHNNYTSSLSKHPAERLLVVSENQELSLYLKNELEKILFKHPLKVDFCYTSLNLNPEQMINIGATEINIKDTATIEKILKDYDLVFSLHCKQIFPQQLVENICCINFHPGFNPFNRGWFPQAFSIINDLPIGATIHIMDSEVDHGNIIAQQKVNIESSDTSLEVYRKIIDMEKQLIKNNLVNIIGGIFDVLPPSEEGNYNSLKNYKEICALNLSATGTLGEHINLLRALTHGNFNNAYFLDNDGKKYFVRIAIERDNSNEAMSIN